jgi:hypothetical protein
LGSRHAAIQPTIAATNGIATRIVNKFATGTDASEPIPSKAFVRLKPIIAM